MAKEYEPVLLLPIGFGCILANIPLTGMTEEMGLFGVLYKAGISTELFPLLIFIGVGAMIDFSPLLAQPQMVLAGRCRAVRHLRHTDPGHAGLGFPLNEAASIGVIGAIDGPTSNLRRCQAGPAAAGADCRGSLLVHEPDPDHPAADHAPAHHQG